MNWRLKAFLILLFTGAMIAADQPTTRVRDVWTDPATGLIWAAKDNGKDVSWREAIKYCRDLRLAGYRDWTLAGMVELQSIYDKSANAPGLAGYRKHERAVTWHVKGDLFLTGYQWANTSSSGNPWYFDPNQGLWDTEPSGFWFSSAGMRALCVRRFGK